jgi:hypothetical protein
VVPLALGGGTISTNMHSALSSTTAAGQAADGGSP